jgi:hypothetical protein
VTPFHISRRGFNGDLLVRGDIEDGILGSEIFLEYSTLDNAVHVPSYRKPQVIE